MNDEATQVHGCVKCARGDHDLCTGYDGPVTTNPDSLPLCSCPCPRHQYDLTIKTCGCGEMMWPEDYPHHLKRAIAGSARVA